MNDNPIAGQESEAAELLVLLASLAPAGVPLAVVADAAKYLPERLAAAVRQPGELERISEHLVSSGLTTRSGDVLAATPEARSQALAGLDDEGRKWWASAAACVVARAFPREPEPQEAWPACARMLPHAAHAAEACLALDAGVEHAAHLVSLMGRFLLARGDYAGAKGLLQRAVALRERVSGADSPAVAMELTWLNGALNGLGEREAVLANAMRALALFEAALGTDNRNVVVHVNNVGAIHRKDGSWAEALPWFQEALRRAERSYGADHPFFATISSNLGESLLALGRAAEARPHLETALRVDEAHYGTVNPSVARDLHKLGLALTALGEKDAARPFLERARAFYQEALPADHPHLDRIRADLAQAGG